MSLSEWLFDRFDRGEVSALLLGSGEGFIADKTWGGHDIGSVVVALEKWAEARADGWQRARAGLAAALETAIADDDAAATLDLLYWTTLSDRGTSAKFDLPASEVAGWVRRTTPQARDHPDARRLVPRVAEHVGLQPEDLWDGEPCTWCRRGAILEQARPTTRTHVRCEWCGTTWEVSGPEPIRRQ